LYDSIYIRDQGGEALLNALDSKPPNFLRNIVKTLMIDTWLPPNWNMAYFMGSILPEFWGVTKFTSAQSVPYSTLAHLRPRHLSISLNSIRHPPSGSLLNQPFFEKITHFEIHLSLQENKLVPFHLLPCLTHLAFNGGPQSPQDLGSVKEILTSCRHLQMLLFLEGIGFTNTQEVLYPALTWSPLLFWGEFQDFNEDWDDHLRGEDVWMKARQLPYIEDCVAE
jgi:hypothetical protein